MKLFLELIVIIIIRNSRSIVISVIVSDKKKIVVFSTQKIGEILEKVLLLFYSTNFAILVIEIAECFIYPEVFLFNFVMKLLHDHHLQGYLTTFGYRLSHESKKIINKNPSISWLLA